jgi:two-component system chemotaxis response regulator CheY
MEEVDYIKQRAHILLLDDSEFSRKNIIEMLTEFGIVIDGEANNFQQATKIINSKPINIVIVDVVMPDISGIEFASHIRDHFKKVQVIMISSLQNEHIVLEAIGAGANDFLFKPVNKEHLILSLYKAAQNLEE